MTVGEAVISILQDIYEISESCSTRTYIWGGMVPDLVQGHLLREHHDIDGFTMDLLEKRAALTECYQARGYIVTFIEEFDMVRIDRDGFHAAFNRLEIHEESAMWHHIGSKGTVYFPKIWLPEEPNSLGGAKAYVSGIELEYCIKKEPSLLNPVWKGREKDSETVSWLRHELVHRGMEPDDLFKSIWTENPFWAERGYREYEKPFRITPGRIT
jgi:hypothetical protein